MAYLSQADIEKRLGTALTADQLAYFNGTLLPAITMIINEQAGTVFENNTSAETYVDGTCSKSLIIPTMSTVTSLYSVDEDGTETLIDSGAYHLYPRTGPILALRNKSGTWSEGFENYKVVGKLGYVAVPADIKVVAMEMAVSDLNANLNSYKSEKVGDWAVTYGDDSSSSGLSSASIFTLGQYNRPSRSV